MWLRFVDPIASMMPGKNVFRAGDDVTMILPETKLWMKFSARVLASDERTIKLTVGEDCWEQVPLQAGLIVQIIKSEDDRIAYIEGKIIQAEKTAASGLIVSHEGNVLRAQRRLFHRFGLRKRFWIESIVLPDATTMPRRRARLLDLSPGGLGFQLRQPLPPGTQFEVKDLFDPLVTELEGIHYFHRVLWSKGNPITGYRHGAIFQFPSETDQNQLLWVIDQLQISRLSWYFHSLTRTAH